MTEMNQNPNLFTESGREHLSLSDRVGFLKADLIGLQMNAPKYDGALAKQDYTKYGHPVHAFNALIGNIRSCISAGEKTPIDPKSWGITCMSRVECCILAWRRGGVTEHDRIHALAWRRPVR